MRIIVADALGFCFGVRDALTATRAIEDAGAVTIHGELVHNRSVLSELAERGFRMADENERQQTPDTPVVLVTAHGISDRERARLEGEGKRLIDTTCPLVKRVHRAAQALAAEGRHVLVVGRPGHVEVQGIVEDLPSSTVVAGASDVRSYAHRRLGIVCQSTTAPRLALDVYWAVCRANPEADIRFLDTICQPTRDRQEALERLLPRVEAMVVVGGRNSNNTRELVALCRERGVATCHVETADDLEPGWFHGRRVVGVTAGTSTPEHVIQEVCQALLRLPE